ncbi:CDC14A, partial [Symbiodinium sp. CCMP2456]
AYKPFQSVYPPFLPYRDATCGICTYSLTVLDCVKGMEKAIECGWFDWKQFDVDSYEFFEKVPILSPETGCSELPHYWGGGGQVEVQTDRWLESEGLRRTAALAQLPLQYGNGVRVSHMHRGKTLEIHV